MVLAGVVPLLGVAWFPDLVRQLLPGTLVQLLPPPLLERATIKKVIWLDQNWSTEDRKWFHHVSVGATLPIPYSWFMALERPEISLITSPGLLADAEYLDRMGFISSPKSGGAADTDGLPVGFAKLTGAFDPSTRNALPDQIGLTCAACHTGRLEYRGASIRFDGGPAMIDMRKFELTVGLAIAYTAYVPMRFDRFASRVLGPDAKAEDRSALKVRLTLLSRSLVEETQQVTRVVAQRTGPPARGSEGFGRLDWLTRIGNQIFFSDLASGGMKGFEKNFQPVTAPVSFPPLWTVPWFANGQGATSSSTLLYGAVAEALGAAALVDLIGITEREAPYRSSIPIRTLSRIEALLRGPALDRGLAAPKWPGASFAGDPKWQIDPGRAEKGRALYGELCAECHLGPLNDIAYDRQYPGRRISESPSFRSEEGSGQKFLVRVAKSARQIGTDPEQARIVSGRSVAVPGFLNLDPVAELGTKRGCKGMVASKSNELPYSVAVMVIADKVINKAVEDLFLPSGQRSALFGTRKDCPDMSSEPVYLARPLNGVWATAPFLHNGSVPTLYDLLSPAAERPNSFCLGAREFDPQKVGLDISASCLRGETEFSATDQSGMTLSGNSNLGHSFEGQRTLPSGAVGRALRSDECLDLIEYLKTL